jgi:hypothetical protein
LQKLNVLYFTLEDSQLDVENRLDSMITGVPIAKLASKPKTTQAKFERYRRFIRSGLRIIDGTQGGFTVAKIEQILLREREQGFHTDALLIDYDDEIVPPRKDKERRFELADIYRGLRQVVSRNNVIGWTAAQTQRDTDTLKIIGGNRVAEDISKIRKVAMAIGVGKGEWGDDSLYLWVAKHRFGKSEVGCHIVSDKERMLIYDREKTREREIEQLGNEAATVE